MLNLNAGIDPEKEKVVAILIDDELDRPGALAINAAREANGSFSDAVDNFTGHEGGGTLFDDLLGPPLKCTVTLSEMNDVSVAVAQNLDLDVSRITDETLD